MKTLEELDPREREIMALLEKNPRGLTSWDVAHLTGHLVHAVRPRFTRLEGVGIVEAVGKRFFAPTKRNETVWALAVGRQAPSGPVSGPAIPGVGLPKPSGEVPA